jgi:hypothetical protein
LRGVNKQEAARPNKAKVATATKMAGEQVPRKGKQTHGGGPKKGTPKKGRTDKFCKWCKAVDGPFTTHNTTECRRFNKDGSHKDKLTKPFDSAKKPWKKPGSGDPAQMAYLTEEMVKLKKRLQKSKKRCKKCAQYLLDTDLTVTRIMGPVARVDHVGVYIVMVCPWTDHILARNPLLEVEADLSRDLERDDFPTRFSLINLESDE